MKNLVLRYCAVIIMGIVALSVISLERASAQNRPSVQFSASGAYHFGYMGNNTLYEITATYLFPISSAFRLGSGIGVGYDQADYIETRLNGTSDEAVATFAVPVFLRAQVDLHPVFFAFRAGTRIGTYKSKNVQNGVFRDPELYPFLFNFCPSIGFTLPLGGHPLGLEIGADLNLTHHYKVVTTQSDALGALVFDHLDRKYGFVPGAYIALLFEI